MLVVVSRQFAALEESAKEEMKKERRRLQEQLRRIKRNQQRESGSPKLTKKQLKELTKHVRADVTTQAQAECSCFPDIVLHTNCFISKFCFVSGIQSLRKYFAIGLRQ